MCHSLAPGPSIAGRTQYATRAPARCGGGAGEIGMNAYVYGYGPAGQERLIVVDLGVTFPDMDGTPGVDLILPDITWLKERRN